MTTNDRKSYIPYLNKLLDQCNNAYHHSIKKKHINANYSVSTENIESNPKAPKFKVNGRLRITNRNIYDRFCFEN